jgi:hypothetical protein
VPEPTDLVLRTNAAPPCGPARRTTILPPAATIVVCACPALADRPGWHRDPRTTVPLHDVRLPPTSQRRDSPGTQPEPGCAPLGVPVIHAVSLQLQLVTRKVRPHNGARRPNVVDRDPRRSSRFGIGAIAWPCRADQDRQSSLPRPDCHALRALRSAEPRGWHDDNRAPEARCVDGHTAQRPLPGPDDDDAAASLDLDPRKRVNLAANLHAALALKREHPGLANLIRRAAGT